jgi:sulfur-oxidizing protein SoxY
MSVWFAMRAECMTATSMTPTAANRRVMLAQSAAFYALLAAGLLGSRPTRSASLELAFDATSLEEALQAMGGIQLQSSEIELAVDDTVENGAFVPVTVSCALPKTQEISIVVESNPNPLVVNFRIPEGTQAYVSTRVKMADSGRVYAVVKADGRLYSTFRETKVTVGGCG